MCQKHNNEAFLKIGKNLDQIPRSRAAAQSSAFDSKNILFVRDNNLQYVPSSPAHHVFWTYPVVLAPSFPRYL